MSKMAQAQRRDDAKRLSLWRGLGWQFNDCRCGIVVKKTGCGTAIFYGQHEITDEMFSFARESNDRHRVTPDNPASTPAGGLFAQESKP